MIMEKKVRESNMEMLRIVAMFLVLLVHADFFSLGAPSTEECVTNPIDASFRVFGEAISIACVDIFVCISGWFGIRPSVRGATNFIFQCLFWLIGLYIVTLIIGTSSFTVEGIKGCFALTKLNWFIKAYLLLYIISPVLNAFVETASRKLFLHVLVGFFVFQTIYGWAFAGATNHIQSGYSTISFVGLYLLSRYVRIYKPTFSQYVFRYYVLNVFILSICVTVFYVTPPHLGVSTTLLGSMWINYISPYCIIFAMSMILLFSKIRLQSNFVNWVGASSFAVFLIHTNPNTVNHFKDFILMLYKHYSVLPFWSLTILFLVLLFMVAVLIDQLRIKLWNMVFPLLENNLKSIR